MIKTTKPYCYFRTAKILSYCKTIFLLIKQCYLQNFKFLLEKLKRNLELFNKSKVQLLYEIGL